MEMEISGNFQPWFVIPWKFGNYNYMYIPAKPVFFFFSDLSELNDTSKNTKPLF